MMDTEDQATRDFVAGERQYALAAIKAERTRHEDSRWHAAQSGMSGVPSGSGDCDCAHLYVNYYKTGIVDSSVTTPINAVLFSDGFTVDASFWHNDAAGSFLVLWQYLAEISTPLTVTVKLSANGRNWTLPAGSVGNITLAGLQDVQIDIGATVSFAPLTMTGIRLNGAGVGDTVNLLATMHVFSICQCGGEATQPPFLRLYCNQRANVTNGVDGFHAPDTGSADSEIIGDLTVSGDAVVIGTAGIYAVEGFVWGSGLADDGYLYAALYMAKAGDTLTTWYDWDTRSTKQIVGEFATVRTRYEGSFVAGDQIGLSSRAVYGGASTADLGAKITVRYCGPTTATVSAF